MATREEELEPLDRWHLRPHDRLGPDQAGQGLVPITRQQQSLQILSKATPLGQRPQAIIEPLGVPSSGPGAGGHGSRFVMAAPPPTAPAGLRPRSTNYR